MNQAQLQIQLQLQQQQPPSLTPHFVTTYGTAGIQPRRLVWFLISPSFFTSLYDNVPLNQRSELIEAFAEYFRLLRDLYTHSIGIYSTTSSEPLYTISAASFFEKIQLSEVLHNMASKWPKFGEQLGIAKGRMRLVEMVKSFLEMSRKSESIVTGHTLTVNMILDKTMPDLEATVSTIQTSLNALVQDSTINLQKVNVNVFFVNNQIQTPTQSSLMNGMSYSCSAKDLYTTFLKSALRDYHLARVGVVAYKLSDPEGGISMHRVELVSPILRTDLAFTGDVTYEFLAIDLPNMTLENAESSSMQTTTFVHSHQLRTLESLFNKDGIIFLQQNPNVQPRVPFTYFIRLCTTSNTMFLHQVRTQALLSPLHTEYPDQVVKYNSLGMETSEAFAEYCRAHVNETIAVGRPKKNYVMPITARAGLTDNPNAKLFLPISEHTVTRYDFDRWTTSQPLHEFLGRSKILDGLLLPIMEIIDSKLSNKIPPAIEQSMATIRNAANNNEVSLFPKLDNNARMEAYKRLLKNMIYTSKYVPNKKFVVLVDSSFSHILSTLNGKSDESTLSGSYSATKMSSEAQAWQKVDKMENMTLREKEEGTIEGTLEVVPQPFIRATSPIAPVATKRAKSTATQKVFYPRYPVKSYLSVSPLELSTAKSQPVTSPPPFALKDLLQHYDCSFGETQERLFYGQKHGLNVGNASAMESERKRKGGGIANGDLEF